LSEELEFQILLAAKGFQQLLAESLWIREVNFCRSRILLEKLEFERPLSGLEAAEVDGWYEADSRM
jgi:hypothetical protein